MSAQSETADLSFRLAIEADAEILLEFMREYYAFDGHSFDPENTPAALLKLLRNPSFGRVWLIFDGKTPVGYVVLCFGYSLEFLGRDAFVDEFYLRENYRGRGWGARAMRFVEEVANDLEIKSLHLEVTRQNVKAKAFYQKLGFQDRAHHLMTKSIACGRSEPVPG
jgi:ribosomal protein S18 acetylase RimI-like enzyme